MATRARLSRLLGVLFRVRSAELPAVVLLFSWCFCVVGAIWLTRAVRDSLFLAHVSAARLPAMYVASPLTVSAVGLGYARLAGRVRADRLIIGGALVIAALLCAARAAVGGGGVWVYYLLYIGADGAASIAGMQFWAVAADQFTARDAKRLIGLIAAGGTVAGIVLGFGVSGLARRAGAENLLFLCALLFLATGALAAQLGRTGGRLGVTARRPAGKGGEVAPGASHLRIVAAMAACAVVTVTLLDFQFKTIAAAAFPGDRVALVRFFGLLAGVTASVALVVQLTLTSRLLARLGVAGVLLLLPALLGVGAVGLLVVPGLAVATFAKAADSTLRYTVSEAGMQLVYLPVPSQVRARVKAKIDAVIRPATEALVGGFLLLARALAVALAPLAGAAVLSATVWALLVIRLRPAYVRSLRETLNRRRLDFERVNVRELAGLIPERDRRVTDALAAAGASSEAELHAVLVDEQGDATRRRHAARALGLLASAEAGAALVAGLGAHDDRLRDVVCESLTRAHRRNAALPIERAALLEACDRELRAASLALSAADELDGGDHASTLIAGTLRERAGAARDRVLVLLEVLHPDRRLEEVLRSLADGDPARRANAIEVLDSVLDRRLRRALVPLCDEHALDLGALRELHGLPRRGREAWLGELLADGSSWVVACATFYAGAHRIGALGDRVRALGGHESPLVREAVAAALPRLGAPC